MNQVYNSLKLSLIFLVLILSSCSTPVILYEEPQPQPVFYETTELELGTDSVFQCWMSYEFDDGDCMVFYVHLVNYSVLSAQFDPADCYLEYKGPGWELDGDNNLRVYALNPAAELQYLAQEKEKEEINNSMDLGFDIVSAAFNIAVNIFDGASGNDAEIVEDVIHLGSDITENVLIGKEQDEFYDQAESFWKHDVLTKTIVQSGEEVSGLVYFPIQRGTREFSAVVPFAGTRNVFEFQLKRM